MDVSIVPITRVDAVSPVEQKAQKKNASAKGSLNFAEVLNNLQQNELAGKIVAGTNAAAKPAAVNFPAVSSGTKSLNILNSRLNGDYTTSLAIENPTDADKNRTPQGNAAGSFSAKGKTIDKTSKLYEQALELESYFVKIMVNTMKDTLSGNVLGKDSYASKMYRDMMFEELSRVVTKNAGFGLADQIYLELT